MKANHIIAIALTTCACGCNQCDKVKDVKLQKPIYGGIIYLDNTRLVCNDKQHWCNWPGTAVVTGRVIKFHKNYYTQTNGGWIQL